MKFKASYKIIPELKLLLEYYEGFITLDSFLKYKNDLISDSAYNNSFCAINDLRNCTLAYNTEELKKYVEFAGKYEHGEDLRRSVTITNAPEQVVLSSMYAKHSHEVNDISFVVSSMLAAIEYLHLPVEQLDNLENILSELRVNLKVY